MILQQVESLDFPGTSTERIKIQINFCLNVAVVFSSFVYLFPQLKIVEFFNQNSMENICRLCLKDGVDHENIFGLKNGRVIADLVQTISPSLTISRSDFLTKEVCVECVEIVWRACELRERSIKSEEYLKFHSESLKVEFVKQEICDDETEESPFMHVTIKEEFIPSETIVYTKPVKVAKNKTNCPHCSKILAESSLPKHLKKFHGTRDDSDSQDSNSSKDTKRRGRKTKKLTSIASSDHLPPIGCSFCFKRFDASNKLNIHLKQVHGVPDPKLILYFCAHCEFSSGHKLKLEMHINSHFGIVSKPFRCSECDFQSLRKGKLELHISRFHLGTLKDFACNLCDIVCRTKTEKKIHHYAHSDIVELCDQDQQILKCTICPDQFQFEDELLQHVATHEEETKNATTACILCVKVLEGFKEILEHTKAQHVQKFTHRCIECNRNYYYGMRFLTHIKNHKEKKSLDHLCTECGAAFTCAADLNKHVRIEHKKVYKCPHCVDVVYKSVRAFRHHVDAHTNNRKFKCPLCPKTFSVRNKFNCHYAFHLNDKVSEGEIVGKCRG
jgi:hypothetical protein